MCPVDLFELYVSKLHKSIPHFWQRPKKGKLHYNDPIWYDKIRVGHRPIENFMAQLSIDANLSKRYTNHSIRSTVMGILAEIYEGRLVIALSGHKNEGSIKMYVRRISEKQKRDMSNTLADIAHPEKVQKLDVKPKEKFHFKPIAPATESKPLKDPKEKPTQAADENPINFDLQPLDNTPTDDVLLNFLQQFDPVTENPPANPQAMQPQVLQEIPLPVANNLMNINNIHNVQNVANPHQNILPNMYFGGHSSVTINYNFGPKQ